MRMRFFGTLHPAVSFLYFVLVLWALADPWSWKLERVKEKFGLVAEAQSYVMPPV